MITEAGNYTVDCIPSEFIGLSTDEKPTDVNNASMFYEMDTKKMFMFDEENTVWHEV